MNWKIRRSDGRCRDCERLFEAGEEHYSILDVGEEDWERHDVCTTCFRSESVGADVLFWRTRRPREDGKKKQVDLEGLLVLLTHLMKLELDPIRRQLRFLIAMILTRKRVLRMQNLERDGSTDWVVLAVPKTEIAYRLEADLPGPKEMPVLKALLQRLFDDETAGDEELLPTLLSDEAIEVPGSGDEGEADADREESGPEPQEGDSSTSPEDVTVGDSRD